MTEESAADLSVLPLGLAPAVPTRPPRRSRSLEFLLLVPALFFACLALAEYAWYLQQSDLARLAARTAATSATAPLADARAVTVLHANGAYIPQDGVTVRSAADGFEVRVALPHQPLTGLFPTLGTLTAREIGPATR